MSNLLENLSMIPSIEIYSFKIEKDEETYDEDTEMIKIFVDSYKCAMIQINKCLMGLYEELEFKE